MRTIIKLKNISPIHIGTGNENYDFSSSWLHSDTISSALASIRVSYFGKNDVENFISSFAVSSMFPYIGDCYFLPKPQGRLNITSDAEEYTYRKKLKTINFIEKSLWQDVVSGKEIKIEEEQIQGGYLLPKNIVKQFEKPLLSQVNQRVAVPRGAGDAEPFFFEWTYFREDAGLYCIVECAESMVKEIEELFKQLGEVGLGTDKNVGGGKFDVELLSMSIAQDAPSANRTMLLSLYIPTEEELQELNISESTYAIQQRGGYISGSVKDQIRHLRKKSVYMFDVGSVFNNTQKLQGKVVDLQPNYNSEDIHPVYRSGKPITVQIRK